ncbi:hypothetical protein [Clostridium sp.]
MFEFLKNMWVMRKCNEGYLITMVAKGRITEEEKRMIVTVPQVI